MRVDKMKGDRIKKYNTLYEEKDNENLVTVKIQQTERASGRKAIQIFIPLTDINKEHNAVSVVPTYKELIHILTGLVELNGKEEVERELGIKMGGR